jgi:hypothetical protein
VFGAKKSITCGLVQKSHQDVVLPVISSIILCVWPTQRR